MNKLSILEKKSTELGCECLRNEPLKNHTTFRIGGECSLMIKINGISACAELIPYAISEGIPYLVLGKGSNVIVSDSGFKGVVFLMGNSFSDYSVNDVVISCEAGLPLSLLCGIALENGLEGLEFAYGIPGSVGGAVYMNAGAYGGEIKDVIISCEVLDKEGRIISIPVEKMDMSYRNSIFMSGGLTVLKASFKLRKGDFNEIKARMESVLSKRREKQPLEYGSAGSTFKRPSNGYASALIDKSGLKGFKVGGAQVSKKHAGFVINKGGASFEDVMGVIRHVQNTVKEKTGVSLECEPVIIE